jgi:catechol 2,3-dioxygenase-like lactoylglutathione lyase family enzyme
LARLLEAAKGEIVLNSASVIAFVATANPSRARDFYQRALGLKLLQEDPFALVFDAHGVMLRVQKVQTIHPAPYTALGWKVSDIHGTIAALTEKGVVFERYSGLPQDPMGVWLSPSGAQVAWFQDPDGNILSLTQF